MADAPETRAVALAILRPKLEPLLSQPGLEYSMLEPALELFGDVGEIRAAVAGARLPGTQSWRSGTQLAEQHTRCWLLQTPRPSWQGCWTL